MNTEEFKKSLVKNREKQNIEDFKKSLLEGKEKQNTISEVDYILWDEIYKEQRQYGDDYKPVKKDIWYGIKNTDACPNCSKVLNKKYLGKQWEKSYGRFWRYYIWSCECGYKYTLLKMNGDE